VWQPFSTVKGGGNDFAARPGGEGKKKRGGEEVSILLHSYQVGGSETQRSRVRGGKKRKGTDLLRVLLKKKEGGGNVTLQRGRKGGKKGRGGKRRGNHYYLGKGVKRKRWEFQPYPQKKRGGGGKGIKFEKRPLRWRGKGKKRVTIFSFEGGCGGGEKNFIKISSSVTGKKKKTDLNNKFTLKRGRKKREKKMVLI